ncbi:MAG: RluA family pseudouridine synthase [Rhodospirillales bacterium]|nr:MAG: RluA family pseudouridine synthase [Rhodospirillales bacterium]
MSPVATIEVTAEERDLRLDRWFRRHYPSLTHGRLEKLLRTGQVRVDGKRARAGLRLAPGQQIRVPPEAGTVAAGSADAGPFISSADRDFVKSLIVHRDDDVIVVNKPSGLAVQGGTRTSRHLDAMLDALRFGKKERPHLVHRLDRDTSGVLVLARSASVAARLGRMFQGRDVRKTYWALVVGRPEPPCGRVDLPLEKRAGRRGERMTVEGRTGRRAATLYRVLESAGPTAAWIALRPLTGRTHQLRVHCAAIGHPIVGDGKYGGAGAYLPSPQIARRLHLHARELVLPHPSGRGALQVRADLPPHMLQSWRFFGFDPNLVGDPFEELDIGDRDAP